MNRETAHYVSECDTYRKVKADYMKPRGLLQHLSILDWKCDYISMEFIMGLALTVRKFDLDDCRSTYQVFSLHIRQHHLQGSKVC
jgi:hypothetical protein